MLTNIGVRSCRGKGNGGHDEVLYSSSTSCPVCARIASNRLNRLALESILYYRSELVNGNISLDTYVSSVKKWESGKLKPSIRTRIALWVMGVK